MDFPCSRSRTNRSPTPDLRESSSCVILNCLRNDLTVADSIFISQIISVRVQIYRIILIYTILGINIHFEYELYHYGYNIPSLFSFTNRYTNCLYYSRTHLTIRLAQQCLPNPRSATLSRKSTTIDHFFVQFLIVEMYIIRNVFINPTQYKNVIFSINQHIFSNSVRNNRSHIFPKRNKGNEFCPNKPRHLRRSNAVVQTNVSNR